MTWLSLLRRAWAVWKLRKQKFFFCCDCTTPLTVEEASHLGEFRCTECLELWEIKTEKEQAKLRNDLSALATRDMLRGQWSHVQAAGLKQQFGSLDSLSGSLGQQLGTINQLGSQNDLLRQLLGQGIHPPDKQ